MNKTKSKNQSIKVIVKNPITKEQSVKMIEKMINDLKTILSN